MSTAPGLPPASGAPFWPPATQPGAPAGPQGMPVRTSPIKAAIAIAFLLLGSYAIYFGASIKNDYQLAIYGALLVFAGLVLAVLALLDRKRSRFV